MTKLKSVLGKYLSASCVTFVALGMCRYVSCPLGSSAKLELVSSESIPCVEMQMTARSSVVGNAVKNGSRPPFGSFVKVTLNCVSSFGSEMVHGEGVGSRFPVIAKALRGVSESPSNHALSMLVPSLNVIYRCLRVLGSMSEEDGSMKPTVGTEMERKVSPGGKWTQSLTAHNAPLFAFRIMSCLGSNFTAYVGMF